MNKPEILGCEVLTPDGRGKILSLHTNRVTVGLNTIKPNQEMKGSPRHQGGMHYSYKYEDVTVIRGQYCFDDKRLRFQYEGKAVNCDRDLKEKS